MSRLTALVPIADGTEEIEAVTIIDTLRRAGIEVTVAAVGLECTVTCSRGVRLVADTLLADWPRQPVDLIVLPGGMPGAEHLRDSTILVSLLFAQQEQGALLGAICAAPAIVLQPLGLLADRRATSHPAFFDRLDPARRSEDRVVHDGNLLTSRGPGTALEFALALVEVLAGSAVRNEVAGPMIVPICAPDGPFCPRLEGIWCDRVSDVAVVRPAPQEPFLRAESPRPRRIVAHQVAAAGRRRRALWRFPSADFHH